MKLCFCSVVNTTPNTYPVGPCSLRKIIKRTVQISGLLYRL
jgi:hypothetical protein